MYIKERAPRYGNRPTKIRGEIYSSAYRHKKQTQAERKRRATKGRNQHLRTHLEEIFPITYV